MGHSIIKQVMAETNAIFGGEHSGHYYYRDNLRADSGIITALLVLELLSVSDKPLSELLEPFQRYSDSGEINTEVRNPGSHGGGDRRTRECHRGDRRSVGRVDDRPR